MSTIDNIEIIITMLKNNGIYPNDPVPYAIYKYKNIHDTSRWTYKIIHPFNSLFYLSEFLSSPYVLTPILLWDIINGITDAGLQLVNERL